MSDRPELRARAREGQLRELRENDFAGKEVVVHSPTQILCQDLEISSSLLAGNRREGEMLRARLALRRSIDDNETVGGAAALIKTCGAVKHVVEKTFERFFLRVKVRALLRAKMNGETGALDKKYWTPVELDPFVSERENVRRARAQIELFRIANDLAERGAPGFQYLEMQLPLRVTEGARGAAPLELEPVGRLVIGRVVPAMAKGGPQQMSAVERARAEHFVLAR